MKTASIIYTTRTASVYVQPNNFSARRPLLFVEKYISADCELPYVFYQLSSMRTSCSAVHWTFLFVIIMAIQRQYPQVR
jgi:hypothetical protein